MADIINLRRARKTKARAAKEKAAENSRIQHGTPKALRDLGRARAEKASRNLENGRLDDDMNRTDK